MSKDQVKRKFIAAGKELQEQWSLCLGRPGSLKIKRASARGNSHDGSIAQEIIKYSVKGSDLVKCSEPIAPILRMLDGTRLLTSFGSAYGHLRDFDMPKQPAACSGCGATGSWVPDAVVAAMMRPAKKRR